MLPGMKIVHVYFKYIIVAVNKWSLIGIFALIFFGSLEFFLGVRGLYSFLSSPDSGTSLGYVFAVFGIPLAGTLKILALILILFFKSFDPKVTRFICINAYILTAIFSPHLLGYIIAQLLCGGSCISL